MTLISLLFLIFIFSINTIEATGPKDLNPEKTKADANLSQSSAVSGAKEKIDLKKDPVTGMKKLSLEKKQALLKQIILEDASSSADLTDPDKKYIQDQSEFKDISINKGLKITVQDDQLKAAGSLKDFIANPNKIEVLLNEAEFIEKIMEAIKADHKLTGEYSYSLKMGDTDTGTFEILFYKNQEILNENLVKIILEDASSSADLTDPDKKVIQDQSEFKDIWIREGLKITVQDDQLKSDGALKDFIANPENINKLFDDTLFKNKIFEKLKVKNPYLDASFKIDIKIMNKANGEFEIAFYKSESKEEGLKRIILENIVSATPLSDFEKNVLKKESNIPIRNSITQAFKISVQDNQLKPDGLLSSVLNKKTLDRVLKQYFFMENIQRDLERNNKKLYGKGRGYLKNINQEQGEVEILIYSTESLRLIDLKKLIIYNLANCRDLDNSEIDVLKADSKIYDSKYISNACEILIEDKLLKRFRQKNFEKVFDIYFKQEIADQVNKPNLNLDKHMSVYPKLNKDKTQLKIIFAETKKAKKPELIKTLEILEILQNNIRINMNKNANETIYEVKYINLAISLSWKDAKFKSGGEFYQSFALIDEILNDPTRRTAWIDRVNKALIDMKIKQTLPNDSNTIIRSQDSKYGFTIDFFTQTQNLKEALQNHILAYTDANIKDKYKNFYESISSSGDIDSFEAGRSLKQGLKFKDIMEVRLFEGGSLSSYYDNAKELNPLLDDEDFKRKVITKINDYFEDKQFSRDNLENIKIKAQNFKDNVYFDLVVYELEPLGESDPTEPSANDSDEPPVDSESAVDGE